MKLEIFSDPDKIFEEDHEVHELTFKQRVMASFKMAGMFFAGALLALPIPVVHLIMVPLCLFLGVASGIWKLRQKIEVSAPELKCPSCKAPHPLQSGLVTWPYRGYCSQCRSQFIVRPKG